MSKIVRRLLSVGRLSGTASSTSKCAISVQTWTLNGDCNLKDDIRSNYESQEKVTQLFLDLSAAFDTVDDDILIKRLKTAFGF